MVFSVNVSMVIKVPEPFAQGIRQREGKAGRDWLDRLPLLIADLCRRWHLIVQGPAMHGHLAIVVPVRRGEERAALKVSWPDTATVHEARALASWDGCGMVRLLESAPTDGAMLLEWLDPRRTLNDVPLSRAAEIAGQLIRTLAIESDADVPTVAELAEGISQSLADRWERLGRPMPRRVVDAAIDHAARTPAATDRRLVNWDLHYGNVLAGVRLPWIAIDPKPAIGPPEFGIAQLLWTRFDELVDAGALRRRLRVLIETADLDSHLVHMWTLVRVVDYWLWALSIGLTEDPARCASIIELLKY